MYGWEKSSSPLPSSAYAFTRAKTCTSLRFPPARGGGSIVHLTDFPFATTFTGPIAVITSSRAGLSVSASTVVSWKATRVNLSSLSPRFAP